MKDKDLALAPQAAVMRWEYNRIGLRTHDTLAHLNELGFEGWELVNLVANMAILKRPMIQENNEK